MRAVYALLVPASAGIAAYACTIPTYNSHASGHAPLRDKDNVVLRHVGYQQIGAAHNPGVRAFPDLLDEKEAKELLKELQPLKQRYGLNLIGPREAAVYTWQQSLLGKPLPPVNMMRITGRPESEQQRLPPWRYGDDFDESKLPPNIASLVARVRALPGLSLGPLRDVTINYRHSGFLRLDPHVDPTADGEDVFIIGVDSDTVLTLCPVARRDLWKWLCTLWDAVCLRDERERVAQEALESWTPWDIDVLAKARTLIHLSGDARWSWTHGTRLGIPVSSHPNTSFPESASEAAQAGSTSNRFCADSQPTSNNNQGIRDSRSSTAMVPNSPYRLHDFWGVPSSVVWRGSERHSVVLAFAAGPS